MKANVKLVGPMVCTLGFMIGGVAQHHVARGAGSTITKQAYCGKWTCNNPAGGGYYNGWETDPLTKQPRAVANCVLFNNQPQVTVCIPPSANDCYVADDTVREKCDGTVLPPPGGGIGTPCWVEFLKCTGTIVPPTP